MPSTVTSTTSIRLSLAGPQTDRTFDRALSIPLPERAKEPALVPAGSLDAQRPDGREGWVTKRQLAAHLQVTPRWIELQYPHGLPYLRREGIVRYRISEVEEWLRSVQQAGGDDAA